MKIIEQIEPLESFLDDKPVFDWDVHTRSHPPKLTAQELARAGILGLCVFIGAMLFLILAFVAL